VGNRGDTAPRDENTMTDMRVIHELYRYNAWANDRLFEAVARLTSSEFTRDVGSSYPSVRETCLHIIWAEWLWLQRWKGLSPQSVFEARDIRTPDALMARWSQVEIERRPFLETLTSERLLAVVQYVNLQGQTWQYPLWRQMYHVVNHSTYHRRQVTTMLRQLGGRAVATDFLVFHDELDAMESKGI
jgi:uncharacterized damage-inducible protein DinB